MDIQTDGTEGSAEISGTVESSIYETDTHQEPFEGMLFESEEAAKAFYDDYAMRISFPTRILSSRRSERDGSIISRGLGCRGGGSDNRKKGEIEKQDKRRESCTAMILLKRETPGRWVVRKFVRDHNHPLVVAQIQKNRRTLDDKDKKIQELSSELRLKKRLCAAYRDQLVSFMKDVEDHNDHLSTKVQYVYDNLGKLDAEWEKLLHHR